MGAMVAQSINMGLRHLRGNYIKVILGFGIGAMALTFLNKIYSFNFSSLLELKINFAYLCIAFVLMFSSFFIQSYRWKTALEPVVGKIKNPIDSVIFIHFFNLFLPLKGGEFLGPYFLHKKTQFSYMKILLSAVFCRAMDMLMVAIISILFVSLAYASLGGSISTILYSIVFLSFVFLGFVFFEKLKTIQWAFKLIFKGFSFDMVNETIEKLRKGSSSKKLLASTFLIWAFGVAAYGLIFMSLGITENIGLTALAAIVFGSFGHALPSLPSGLGTFNASIIVVFEFLRALNPDSLLSFGGVNFFEASFFVYLAVSAPEFFAGMICLIRRKI